jgi:tetratricopeptide (TPR) repeat protein
MKDNTAFFDQIDDFLVGKLSAQAQEAMQQAIAQNERLAQEVAIRKMEFEVSEAIIAGDIRAHFTQLRDNLAPQEQPNPLSKKWWWLLLVAVVVTSCIAWFLWPTPLNPPVEQNLPMILNDSIAAVDTTDKLPRIQTSSPAQLTQNFRALAQAAYSDPDLSTLRTATLRNSSSKKDQIKAAWDNQDFKTVINILEETNKNEPDYIQSRYFIAHALYKLGKYKDAADMFGTVSNSKLLPSSEEADWFVLVAILVAQPFDQQAFKQREKVILNDPQHPYYNQLAKLKIDIQK